MGTQLHSVRGTHGTILSTYAPSKGNASRHVAYAKGSVMTTRMRVDELKLGDLYVLLFEYSVPLRSIKAIRVSSAGGGGLKHDDTQSCLN